MKSPDLTLCRLLSSEVDAALTSTLSPDDWRLLASAARREGVAPLLYRILEEQKSRKTEGQTRTGQRPSAPLLPCPPAPLLRVPADVRADLRQAYYAATARNLLLYRELSRILTALSPIPVVILKGAALAATLYPSIGLRSMGDLDLLATEDRLAEAVARLKALGYVQPHPEMTAGLNALAGHHVHLQGGQDLRLAVELHWTLVGGRHDWRCPSLPWFWSQTEEWKMEEGRGKLEGGNEIPSSTLHFPSLRLGSGQASTFQLTPTARLLYLSAHLMLQHGEARSPLRWFYDIHLLVTREGQRMDWDELVVRARQFHWAPALRAALAGAAARFATPLPAGLLESLMDGADPRDQALVQRKARPQTRGERVGDALASLGWRARLSLVLANVAPSPAYVRWRYKPRPAWLWPLCYPYRWFDTLREGLSTLWKIARRRRRCRSSNIEQSGDLGNRAEHAGIHH